jgi:hypothetical protein
MQVMDKAQSAHVDTVDLATAHRGAHDAIEYALDVSRYLISRHKLRGIQDEADVQIFVPRPESITAGNTAIEIVGKVKEAVDRARAEVDAVVKAVPPTSITKVDVDSLVHRHLIGKKHQRIRAFEEKKSVDIVFPPSGEDRDDLLVVYVGNGDGKPVLEGQQETFLCLSSMEATRADDIIYGFFSQRQLLSCRNLQRRQLISRSLLSTCRPSSTDMYSVPTERRSTL